MSTIATEHHDHCHGYCRVRSLRSAISTNIICTFFLQILPEKLKIIVINDDFFFFFFLVTASTKIPNICLWLCMAEAKTF